MRAAIVWALLLLTVPCMVSAGSQGNFGVTLNVFSYANGCFGGGYKDLSGNCWYASNGSTMSCTAICSHMDMLCYPHNPDVNCVYCNRVNPSFGCSDLGTSANNYMPGYDGSSCYWTSNYTSYGGVCDTPAPSGFTRVCVCGMPTTSTTTTTTTTTTTSTTSTTLGGGGGGGGGGAPVTTTSLAGNLTLMAAPVNQTITDQLINLLSGNGGIAQVWIFLAIFAAWWLIAGKKKKHGKQYD